VHQLLAGDGLGDQTEDARRRVDRWLGAVYPPASGQRWGTVQPDRLAEHLAASVLTSNQELLAGSLAPATDDQSGQALTLVTRALTNPSVSPDQRNSLRDQLRSVLSARLDRLGPDAADQRLWELTGVWFRPVLPMPTIPVGKLK
jgi:hypothetical protein